MTFESTVEILPSSIYAKGPATNNRKLWNLFSEQLDEIENAFKFWYDRLDLEGEALDKIGLLKGIARNGLPDIDYRYELSLPRTLEIVSIPSVYETVAQFGWNPRIKELHTPYNFDIDRMNSNKVLDASYPLLAAFEPVILNYLDGNSNLDGLEPLEPLGVRRLAVLIQLTTDVSFEFSNAQSEVKKLLAGVTVYYQFCFDISLGLDFDNMSTRLDASFLLDGMRTLSTDVKVEFYNGATFLYSLPLVIIDGERFEFSTQKKDYTITKFRIVRSGFILGEYDSGVFKTSVYLQYKFTIK